jgi:hypothetical protein
MSICPCSDGRPFSSAEALEDALVQSDNPEDQALVAAIRRFRDQYSTLSDKQRYNTEQDNNDVFWNDVMPHVKNMLHVRWINILGLQSHIPLWTSIDFLLDNYEEELQSLEHGSNLFIEMALLGCISHDSQDGIQTKDSKQRAYLHAFMPASMALYISDQLGEEYLVLRDHYKWNVTTEYDNGQRELYTNLPLYPQDTAEALVVAMDSEKLLSQYNDCPWINCTIVSLQYGTQEEIKGWDIYETLNYKVLQTIKNGWHGLTKFQQDKYAAESERLRTN